MQVTLTHSTHSTLANEYVFANLRPFSLAFAAFARASLFNRRVGTIATATPPGVNDQHPQYPTYICTGTA